MKNNMQEFKKVMADSKFYMDYSRWIDSQNRSETWEDAVKRVMDMHRDYYRHVMNEELSKLIDFVESMYLSKKIVGSQRALQFGGEQLLKHPTRLYNCSASYCDRPRFFQETFFMLLCGAGVGFSVQKHHVAKLPKIKKRSNKETKTFIVEDSIEGWSDAVGVLLSSYFIDGGEFPEYKDCKVEFDFSNIRPKGAYISGGFKAPGPDGLMNSLKKCEELLDAQFKDDIVTDMRPIVAYDLVMHISDAVLSGGVRRSATICLFSKDDNEMLNSKTGDWFVTNPQRGRSNNSVVIKRDEITRNEWAEIMKSVKQVGEPGFVFVDDYEHLMNPCCEIGLRSYDLVTGESGFSMCNLTEINGALCFTKDDVKLASKAASILGTLQAGYTNFTYLTEASKRIVEREALLGVSITGWMNNPELLFDETVMKEGALEVKRWNKVVAKIIGINEAARTTCTKPSGNTSTMLGCASGIHAEHAPMYFRNVQMNEQSDILQEIVSKNPAMVEESHWSNNKTDMVVSFPIVSNDGSIYKKDVMGVKQLEYVMKAQQVWVEYGTNVEHCIDPNQRHNISNTISVDDWDAVEDFIFENRQWFTGVSLLSAMGDKAYTQAPFTEVFTKQQITAIYNVPYGIMDELIFKGKTTFNNDLWRACDTLLGWGENLSLIEDKADRLWKENWVLEAKKYAKLHFEDNLHRLCDYMKDCYNASRWDTIVENYISVDLKNAKKSQTYTDVDTMGAAACSGGKCEL